jgi:hypothetical protein
VRSEAGNQAYLHREIARCPSNNLRNGWHGLKNLRQSS